MYTRQHIQLTHGHHNLIYNANDILIIGNPQYVRYPSLVQIIRGQQQALGQAGGLAITVQLQFELARYARLVEVTGGVEDPGFDLQLGLPLSTASRAFYHDRSSGM